MIGTEYEVGYTSYTRLNDDYGDYDDDGHDGDRDDGHDALYRLALK